MRSVYLLIKAAALPRHVAERPCLYVANSVKKLREALPRAVLFAALLLLTAHISLLTAYASSWTRQTSGTMAWLHSVCFIDQNRGWVTGTNGTLLRTTDGGATWKKISTFTRDTLRDVYFSDEAHGWLLAERDLLKLQTNDEARSYLLKTNDGGITWQRVVVRTPEVNVRLVRMIFADAQHGWLLGETGIIFGTVDGGAHWLRQASPTKHLLLGAAFLDPTHAWFVGTGATVINTNDGGETWINATLTQPTNIRLNAASFVTHNLGWAVADGGKVFTTSNGGRSWYPQRSNVDADLLDVKFVSPTEGWAAGADGLLIHTNDAGGHWRVESTNSAHVLQRLFFIDRNHGWAVGFGGTILTIGTAQPPALR